MGLDSFFFKCKRGSLERYQTAHEKWQEKQPKSSKINNDDYEKLPEEKKAKIQEKLRAWYDKEPTHEKYGFKEVGYFRKVNFLMSFFDYYDNCSYMEVSMAKLLDLKERAEKVLSCEPIEKVRHDYPINKELEQFAKELSDEEKKAFNVEEYLAGENIPVNEQTIHDVRYALGLDEAIEGEDYWIENIYSEEAQELASSLLPTQSGFFYGSTEYDHWYWLDVKEVNEWLDTVLKDFDDNKEELYFYCWY